MEEKKELELIDYLDVIWRKKLLIVIPTFLLMLLAGYCSFRAPLTFAADAVIAPGSILLQTPAGRLEKVQLVDPMQLAIEIRQGAYNADIAAALNLGPYEIAGIMAENLRDPEAPQYQRGTDLILVSTVGLDTDRAQAILNQLFRLVKEDLDAKVEVEIVAIDSRLEGYQSRIKEKEIAIQENENQISLTALGIKDKNEEINATEREIAKKQNTIQSKKLEIESVEIEKGRLSDEIKNFQNKIQLLVERDEILQAELKNVNDRIKQIEAQQKQALDTKKTGEQMIGLLLYSTEIQHALRFAVEIEERIHEGKSEQEDYTLEIDRTEELIKQGDNRIRQIEAQIVTIEANIEIDRIQIRGIQNQSEKIKKLITSIENDNKKIKAEIESLESEIKLVESEKARISHTELIKAPSPSITPGGRNPLYMMIIVGFISAMMFTVLAFLIDYIQKNRKPRSA